MALSPGTKLGHYEIVEPLGAGGMGEVYRARDVRLGRDVAVKVLPESISTNPDVRARFEREAKTISSLNHPHICVLHDVGRESDTDYLVMELIEGETLDARLARGPLPPDEVVKVGAQIADALETAHRAGVVHRDLKPGNIMVTRSGAKLMDFGLARLAAPQSGGMDKTIAQLSESPTEAQPLTAEGAIVGTFQYMAPEQLEGGEVNERSDLWALGCVLYEMATGKRAFEAKSQASLIGAIMHQEPAPVSQVVPVAPAQLDRLISACITKDPGNRVQSAHDVRLQLEWIGEGGPEAAPGIAAASGTRGAGWKTLGVVAAVAVVVTAALTMFLTGGPSRTTTPASPQRYILGSADMRPASAPALSPDGSYVVFSVREGSSCRLYRRSLSSWDMTPIAGTEEGRAPFFSPGGAWIGFCTPDAIRKVPADGGAAQLVVSYSSPTAGDWGEDGTIYFTASGGGEDGGAAMLRVPDTGGRAEAFAALDRSGGDGDAWLPEILPGGETVLLSIVNAGSNQIVAFGPGGSRTTVVEGGFLARYTDSGYILYRDDESEAILAAPFDADGLRVTGAAVPLTEAVNASYCFDVIPGGPLVYVPIPGAGARAEVVWVDRNGKTEPAADTQASWAQPRISPDGSRVLLRKTGTSCELWLLDIERNSLGRIVQTDDNHSPVWSPDGTRIAFQRQNAREVVAMSVTGPRQVDVVTDDHFGSPVSWCAEGNLLALTVQGRGTRSDIWVVDMDSSGEPEPFLVTEFEEELPDFHPGGRWLAYTSNETGERDVYIRTWPDGDTTWQVSTGGGNSPVWSRDGNELYFLAGSKLMAAAISTEPALQIGVPAEILDGAINVERDRNFDVGPDGRFVTIRRAGDDGGLQEMRVLLNWSREITRMTGPTH